jgi:hypothetical protein
MYDFYFGTKKEILADEVRFLVSVKRMLPKWMNSIPDSEFTAVCRLLQTLEKARRGPLVLTESGAGASSLALSYFAMKTGGRAYSWDINGEKGSHLRTVMTETFANVLGKDVNRHWRMVAFSSLSPHLGFSILGELERKGVDYYMHDSHHVLETVLGELRAVEPLLKEGAVVALDDAHYDFRHTDEAYVNVFRRKLGLPPIAPIPGNRCRPFHEEVRGFLEARWKKLLPLDKFYREAVKGDIFFDYFSSETKVRAHMGMERVKQLEHRLHAWQLKGRR